MLINMRTDYDALLQAFVSDNYDSLANAKVYRPNPDRESCWNYIAERNQTTDVDYLRVNPNFIALVTTFVDKFLYREGMKFQLRHHLKELDGSLLTELMDQTDNSYGYNYFSRDNLIKHFSLHLLMDVFTLFIYIRDKKTGHVGYHLFGFDDNRIEIKPATTCATCNAYFALVVDYYQNAIIVDDLICIRSHTIQSDLF